MAVCIRPLSLPKPSSHGVYSSLLLSPSPPATVAMSERGWLKPSQRSAPLMLSPAELGHHPAVLCSAACLHPHTCKQKQMHAGRDAHATATTNRARARPRRMHWKSRTNRPTPPHTFPNTRLNSGFVLLLGGLLKHAHAENVGQAQRIYSRIRNTGANYPLSVSSLRQEPSALNQMVTWRFLKRTRRLQIQIL